MKTRLPNILFITPSLANTGSEVLLFNYLRFIAPRYHITMICYKRGNLIAQLPESIKVHCLGLSEANNFANKLQRRFIFHFTLPRLLKKFENSAWYINTIVLPLPVKYAIKHNIQFILHVHELKHMYSLLNSTELNAALNKPELLIANSTITKSHLLAAGSKKDIQVISPFIDLELIQKIKANSNLRLDSTFQWLMAGSIDKNKNPGLFIAIAKLAKVQNLPYRFVWLYNSISDQDLFSHAKLEELQMGDTLRFIKTENYDQYLNMIHQSHGLLLTSTYESFSILTVEALAMNLAIVVNDCGGVTETTDERTASIIDLNSPLETYLKAMKYELGRSSQIIPEKDAIVRKFDKTKILATWENIMLHH